MALLPHMKERGSGHIVNAVGAGGLEPRDPITAAYDTGHAAVAAFTRSLSPQLKARGVSVTLFCISRTGPRIGQNTRSRGMGRLLHPTEDLEESAPPADEVVDSLLDVLHHPRLMGGPEAK